MDIKNISDKLEPEKKAAAAEKAKAIASSLSDREIAAIKRCASKAGSIKELFSDPEFKDIIERRRQ